MLLGRLSEAVQQGRKADDLVLYQTGKDRMRREQSWRLLKDIQKVITGLGDMLVVDV